MTCVGATDLARELMAACQDAVNKRPLFAGQGIVICAGGAQMLTNAYVLVRVLREILDCRLPIEIWHIGAREMPANLAGLLETFGCRIVDADAVRRSFAAEIHDGWQLKSYALLHSAFDDVILLDADQVPLMDPAVLLDWPEYRGTGAVFWPDILELSAENPVWSLVGLEARRIRSWETGQAAVNKTRHWKSLWLAFEINQRADQFYEIIYGDKDTFLLAWLMTGADHALVEHPPFRDQKYLVQRDFAGRSLFQHRTNCKWSLHERPDRPPGLLHQETCERFLDELREVWNGRIFHPPQRTVEAIAVEREMIEEREFSLFIGTGTPIGLQLLAGHQIGQGRSFHLSNWYVEAYADEYRLVFCDHDGRNLVLQGPDEGRWHGEALPAEGATAILKPLSGRSGTPPRRRYSLADSFVDAAHRTAPGGPFDRDSLMGALRLLERIEPGSLNAVADRARRLEEGDSLAAAELREIVDALTRDEPPPAARPRDKSIGIFNNPDLYRRL
jgi:hypothetical protein